MLAVNEPTVVLASAQVKFVGPVIAGDRIEAEATVERTEGKKRWVKVVARREGMPVLEGELFAIVPDKHMLVGEAARADDVHDRAQSDGRRLVGTVRRCDERLPVIASPPASLTGPPTSMRSSARPSRRIPPVKR